MNVHKIMIVASSCVLLAGCHKSVRPISNSGFEGQGSALTLCPVRRQVPPFEYRGELNEFDVLGITRDAFASDAAIRHALENARRLKLQPGSSILLIQSGAAFPDASIVDELSKTFRVVPFSGVPPARKAGTDQNEDPLDAEAFSRSLRLAAAQAGNDTILCYWGLIESESERLPTRTVSWVPLVNWMLPDEIQHMRIRVKMALVDVRSGSWAVVSPPAVTGGHWSTSPRREAVDQKQVERLKEKAYSGAVGELVRLYSSK